MRTMHLFAGAGGGLLADLILGHKPVVAVEWDRYACEVLRERASDGWFPDLHVWEGDVRLFDPSDYAGRVDCIHAGFPCQDISLAGKQAGLGEETRSGLYRQVIRIASHLRPKYIFLENVAAILSSGVGSVYGDVASLGYDIRQCCLRASDVGALHHRDRWWCLCKRKESDCLGYTHNNGSSSQSQLRGDEAASHQRGEEKQESSGESEGANRPTDVSSLSRGKSGGQQDAVLDDTDCKHSHALRRSCMEKGSAIAPYSAGQQSSFMAHSNSARLEGWQESSEISRGGEASIEQFAGLHQPLPASYWSTEPQLGRVADGVAHRVDKLKALGNGQVPLQAAVAFKMLEGLFYESCTKQ